jgi:hypothetical protein
MDANNPQFTYMVLILPSLFGLTLVGEGLNKIFHQRLSGWLSVLAGVGFMVTVIWAYTFLLGAV